MLFFTGQIKTTYSLWYYNVAFNDDDVLYPACNARVYSMTFVDYIAEYFFEVAFSRPDMRHEKLVVSNHPNFLQSGLLISAKDGTSY